MSPTDSRSAARELAQLHLLLLLAEIVPTTFDAPGLESIAATAGAYMIEQEKPFFRFDLRRRMHRVRKRDGVGHNFDPQEIYWFEEAERRLVGATKRIYPEFDIFLEWYADPQVHRRYGPRVRPALLCLYWGWAEPDPAHSGDLRLNWHTFRDRLRYSPLPISGKLADGSEPSLIIQGNPMVEFAWWGGYLAAYQSYIMEAINEYRELWRGGRIARWRRKMRRRAAAAARAAAKAAEEERISAQRAAIEDEQSEMLREALGPEIWAELQASAAEAASIRAAALIGATNPADDKPDVGDPNAGVIVDDDDDIDDDAEVEEVEEVEEPTALPLDDDDIAVEVLTNPALGRAPDDDSDEEEYMSEAEAYR